MRQECCGKPLRTPYCPYCGNKGDSEESLLMFLKYEQKIAEQQCMWLRARLNPERKGYKASKVETVQAHLKTWTNKVERLSKWIAFVEAALANSSAKKTIE